jgi:hypothetical protein
MYKCSYYCFYLCKRIPRRFCRVYISMHEWQGRIIVVCVLPPYPSAMAHFDWTAQILAASFKLTQLLLHSKTSMNWSMTSKQIYFYNYVCSFQSYLAQRVRDINTHLNRSVQDLYNLPNVTYSRLWIHWFKHSVWVVRNSIIIHDIWTFGKYNK